MLAGPSEIVLTARELDLLVALARRDGGMVSKPELLAEVWGFDFDGDDNIVEVYVGYLRTKIDRPFARNSLQTVGTRGNRELTIGEEVGNLRGGGRVGGPLLAEKEERGKTTGAARGLCRLPDRRGRRAAACARERARR